MLEIFKKRLKDLVIYTMYYTMPRYRRRATKRSNPRKTVTRADVVKIARGVNEMKEKTIRHTTLGVNSCGYGASAVTAYMANQITVGDGDTYRNGNQIFLSRIQYQFAMAAGDTTNYLRLLFVMPKKAYNYGSTVSQLVEEVLDAASSNTQWLGLVDTDRYRVLHDKKLFLEYIADTGSTAAVHAVGKIIQGSIEVNKKIQWAYSAAAGVECPVTDVIMIAISDSAAVSHPGAVAGNLKMFYRDM